MPENENPPKKRNKEKIKDVQLFSIFCQEKRTQAQKLLPVL